MGRPRANPTLAFLPVTVIPLFARDESGHCNRNPYPKTICNFSSLPGIELLAKTRIWCSFDGMKTLTVEEATTGLGRLVELALAGEQIQIRKGSGIVELRPASAPQIPVDEELTPREALRLLQEDARLTPQQAERYLRDLREERLAADDRRSA